MPLDSTLFRNPRILLVPGSDGYAAYHTDTGRIHRLNASAALILELFDGTRTMREVCADLQPILGPSGISAAKRWIDYAVSEGFLSSVSHPSELLRPFSASAATKRAQRLRDEGQILAAYACQHHVSTLTPENPEVWKDLGELAHILGRREDARNAYEKCLSLHPDDAEIGHILLSLRDECPPPRAPDACVRQIYSRFADYYEENMCDELHYQAPSLLAVAVREAISTRDSLEVLDLGCGTGLIAEHLRPLARRLTGIDLSPEMVDRARQSEFYDLLEVAEITDWLSWDSKPAFDLIVACDTLIYFGDLSQVVVPAANCLGPGGILAFTVEKGSHNEPFCLTDSGRYTHTIDHITSVAEDARLGLDRICTEVLRYEYSEPVEGLLVVLSRS